MGAESESVDREGDGRQLITLPYSSATAGGAERPYLWLYLTGLNGNSGPILGLIDTGADYSVLPLGYAGLMGYGPDQLESSEVHGVGDTSVDVFLAKEPCTAYVEGLEDVVFEMRPVFTNQDQALWGRADFFSVFGFYMDEAAQEFGLLLPEGATSPG